MPGAAGRAVTHSHAHAHTVAVAVAVTHSHAHPVAYYDSFAKRVFDGHGVDPDRQPQPVGVVLPVLSLRHHDRLRHDDSVRYHDRGVS
jgi:hypothetical protein